MSVTKSAIPRGLAYKIAGFFFWPLLFPGTIDTIKTYKSHKALKKDFTAKGIKDEVIAPYSTFNRVIFVPLKQYKKNFTVTLVDQETKRDVRWESKA